MRQTTSNQYRRNIKASQFYENNRIHSLHKMSDMSHKRVNFADCQEAGPSKRFAAPEDHSGENTEMDQETAKTLFENGAFLILLNVPANTEIGIDLHSWRTGNEMIEKLSPLWSILVKF